MTETTQATKNDLTVGKDLQDTLAENREHCVGMAANMIGVRKTTRYQNIEVEFTDNTWNRQRKKFSGWTAQIIQHECDHLEGIVI